MNNYHKKQEIITEKYNCLVCNKEFYRFPSQLRKGTCSKGCGYKIRKIPLNDGQFKKSFIPWNKGKPMSEEHKKILSNARMKSKYRTGINHPKWKGGKTTNNGYIVLNNNISERNKKYFEHRLVMEKHIGRILTKEERIHHINGIHNDNKIKNLYLCKNSGEHSKLHNKMNKFVYMLINSEIAYLDKKDGEFKLYKKGNENIWQLNRDTQKS